MNESLDWLLYVRHEMLSKKLLSQICIDASVLFKKEHPDCGRLLLEMSQDHKQLVQQFLLFVWCD